MGSCLSIGFVYDKPRELLSTQLEHLIHYIVFKKDDIKCIKASEDVEGEEWNEINSLNNFPITDLCNLLSDFFYGEVHLLCDFLGYKERKVVIRVEKEKDFFGFLVDISYNELLYSVNSDELDSIVDKIINFIQGFHTNSSYEYVFCDTEAKIEYSFEEYNSINEPLYSIVIIPVFDRFNTVFKVQKSKWNIDGLTLR